MARKPLSFTIKRTTHAHAGNNGFVAARKTNIVHVSAGKGSGGGGGGRGRRRRDRHGRYA